MRVLSSLLNAVPRNQPSKLRQPKGSLTQFIWKRRVLGLYRDIVRALNKIPSSEMREEMRSYARRGFEQHRDLTEETHIRYLVSTGKAELDTMSRYIDQMTRR